MIAPKKEWLDNLRVQEEAEKFKLKGHIAQAEYETVCHKYTVGFYMPNVFVRAGLFIVTFIVMLFGDGLLTLMASSGNVIESFGWPLFLGLISYGCLEAVIAAKHHFRSGVDDALLLITTLSFAFAFAAAFGRMGSDDAVRSEWVSFGMFVTTLYFTIRFLDRLMAAICCGSFFATIFYLWNNEGFGGLNTAPFVMILVSAGVYWLISGLAKNRAFINYEECLLVVKILSLVTLYAAGNYWVVQTLGSSLNPGQPANTPLPLGGFFWSWTMLIPLIYLAFGIRKKNVILLRLGLILIVAAVCTFRNYYHLLPTDIMLTVAGVSVIAISWLIIRYLKTPKYGFTYEEPDQQTALDHAHIESLITAQTVAGMQSSPSNSGSRFGGGDFGGGGSSGSF